jgi:hypothetical protein
MVLQQQVVPLSYAKALESKRLYRKQPSIDKLKFLSSCNCEEEWEKAAAILGQVNENVIDLTKAQVMLKKHLNTRRLQRQMLIWLNMRQWSDFEAEYPDHAKLEKLDILLGTLGNPTVNVSVRTTGWFDNVAGVDPVTTLRIPDPRILTYLEEADRLKNLQNRAPTDTEGLEGE